MEFNSEEIAGPLRSSLGESLSPEAAQAMQDAAQEAQRAKVGLAQNLSQTPTELPPSGDAASSAGVFNATPPSALEHAQNMQDLGLLPEGSVQDAIKNKSNPYDHLDDVATQELEGLPPEEKASIEDLISKHKNGDPEATKQLHGIIDELGKTKASAKPEVESSEPTKPIESDSTSDEAVEPEVKEAISPDQETIDPVTDKIMTEKIPSWKNMSVSQKAKMLTNFGMKSAVIGATALGAGSALMSGGGGSKPPQAQQAAPAPVGATPDSANKPFEAKNEDQGEEEQTPVQPKGGAPATSIASPATDPLSALMAARSSGQPNLAQQLQAAQNARNNATQNARIMQGANTISAALTRQKATPEAFEGPIKDSEHYITDLTQKIQMEQFDPNSDTSRGMRALAQSALGRPIPENVDAATLTKAMPAIQKAYLQDAIQKRQESLLGQRLQGQKELKTMGLDASAGKTDEKSAQTIAKSLNGLTASSRSALGRAAQANVSISRLIDIAQNPKSTSQDLSSAAADLNQVVSGAATISGAHAQEYHTLMGDFANKWQYISSNPTAPDVPQIKQHLVDVATRMKKISDDVLDQNTKLVQAGNEKWIARNPDQWKHMLVAAGGGVQSAQVSPQKEAAIQSVMKANPGISREDAINALEQAKK